MKASRQQIERALDRPGAETRFFLLYGPDESGSNALAERLSRAMGADAEKVELDGAALAKDPARLADEAASMSLFGGARHIHLRLAGDEAADAIDALLANPQAGNPVVAVAGVLKPASRLLKRALAAPNALAFASYAPSGEDAVRMVAAMGRDAGLRVPPDVAARLIEATAGDRAILAREIEKLALFLDAAPDRPGEADHDSIDRVGADLGETDLTRLVDAVLGGAPDATAHELERLAAASALTPQVVRAFGRRLSLLLRLRRDIDRGRGIGDVMASAISSKALFFKDEQDVRRQLRIWDSDGLSRIQSRLLAIDRDLKSSRNAGTVLAENDLLAISRAAARRR